MPACAARASICFCTSGVSTQPGQMALTVTPVVAVSSAMLLVNPTMPCLARDVGRLLGRGHQAVGRSDVDDAAPVASLHAGQRQARGVERRAQVDRDDRVPAIGRKVLDFGDVLDAGVVHQDVERAELLLAGTHHRLDLGRACSCRRRDTTTLTPSSATARLADSYSPKPLSMMLAPSPGQRQCDAEADAAGGARDQGGLSLQHGGSLPFSC